MHLLSGFILKMLRENMELIQVRGKAVTECGDSRFCFLMALVK